MNIISSLKNLFALFSDGDLPQKAEKISQAIEAGKAETVATTLATITEAQQDSYMYRHFYNHTAHAIKIGNLDVFKALLKACNDNPLYQSVRIVSAPLTTHTFFMPSFYTQAVAHEQFEIANFIVEKVAEQQSISVSVAQLRLSQNGFNNLKAAPR